VKAEIGQIQGMSAHGDCDDLCRFISSQDPETVKAIFLVHGEYTVQKAFASKLEIRGFKNIEIPTLHQELELLNTELKPKVKAA
jgi:metallo-beta-lactamase family protein